MRVLVEAASCTLICLFAAATASAGVFRLDFETAPSIPVQPDNFADAGPMQVYNSPGLYTISGGTVLGNPTLLPAFDNHGSTPNLYGTSDLADPSLSATVTLIFPAAAHVISVRGVIFNGLTDPEHYEAKAFSGGVLISSQSFGSVPENFASGFQLFDLASDTGTPLTQVTITSPNANVYGWTFFVDSIEIQTVPEPNTAGFVLLALMGTALRVAFRHRTRPADVLSPKN